MLEVAGGKKVLGKLAALLAALVLAFVLAGCSSEDADDDADVDEGSATVEESATAEDEADEADDADDADATAEDEDSDADATAEEDADDADVDELLSSYATSYEHLAGSTYEGSFVIDGDYATYIFADDLADQSLAWHVEDFDGDDQSELLLISAELGESEEGSIYPDVLDAVLVMYEVVDGEVKAVAECTLEGAAVVSREEASAQWGVAEVDGQTCIVYECWSLASYLADGTTLEFTAVNYDGSDFQTVVEASISGSDFSAEVDGEIVEYDGGSFSESLEEAGISADFEALVENTATICGDSLGADVFCTVTVEPAISVDEYAEWLDSASDGDVIAATSITIEELD